MSHAKMRAGMKSTTRDALIWNQTIAKEQMLAERCRNEYFERDEAEWVKRDKPLQNVAEDVELPPSPEKHYHHMRPLDEDIPEKKTLIGLTRIDKGRAKDQSFHFMKMW